MIDQISSTFDEQKNEELISSVLSGLSSERLLQFLSMYVDFNSVFAGGVASLAGAIHVRQDLFQDTNDEIIGCRDRSAEIASLVFYAAEDEYCAHRSAVRVTHRSLAQRLIRSTVSILDMPPNCATACNSQFKAMVCHNYGIGRVLGDFDVFRGLGFHIASELLADQEFRVIDRVLEKEHRGLVEALRKSQNAYFWIKEHCTVELEHHVAAVNALKAAVRYYSGDADSSTLAAKASEGFEAFSELQRHMFEEIHERNLRTPVVS